MVCPPDWSPGARPYRDVTRFEGAATRLIAGVTGAR
jgi:hypothetical protein